MPERRRAQNMPFAFAESSATGWITSQCSTTLPSSSRKKSASARPGLTGLQCQVRVGGDHVALGDGSLDVQGEVGVLAPQPMNEVDERFGPVGGLRVVLDVYRPEVLSDGALGVTGKGGAVVVEDDCRVVFGGGHGELLHGVR